MKSGLQRFKSVGALGPCCLLLLLPIWRAGAGDWPQYRGPNHDESSSENIRTNWIEQAPRIFWRKAFEPGFSAVVTADGRLFTQVKRAVNGTNREFAVCLDAATGAEIWSVNLGPAQYTDLAGYDDRMDGPRSTPSVASDRVFFFTSQLKFYALRTDTGATLWSRDFVAEFGSDVIAWQNAASPLVAGDLIFLNSNAPGHRLAAIRKSDGTTAWSEEDDVMTHASPVYARLYDISQIIFLTGSGLVSKIPETGMTLWRLPFTPSSTSTAASPVVAGDYVLASAAYSAGTWVGRVTKNGDNFSAIQSYRQRGNTFQSHWATPVAHEGFIYAVPSPSSGQARLVCLDVAAGANRWEQSQAGSKNIGYGTLIKAANTLVVLTESGELVLVEPNPTAYVETARFKILDAFCWNHVALANGRIYARSTSPSNPELVAVDVSEAALPLPPIELAAQRLSGNGGLKLTIRATNGPGLQPADASRLELLTNAGVTKPPSQWTVLPASLAAEAGAFTTEITNLGSGAVFLMVRERSTN